VFQAKVWLENGTGHGDFFIPSNFASGAYTLVTYTRWMKNFAAGYFFRNQVTIINPFMRSTETTGRGGSVSSGVNTTSLPGPNQVQLKLSGNSFKTRERVNLTLTASTAATVSVSVRKKETALNDAGTMLRFTPQSVSNMADKVQVRYVPEMRGHLITGKLIAGDGDSTGGKTILASMPGPNFVLRATRTDPAGNFVMIVDSIPGSSAFLFQVVDPDSKDAALKIDNPFLDDYSNFLPGPMQVDAGAWKIVDERNVFAQIENAYYQAEKNVTKVKPSKSFYGTPDKVYRLDDFTRFPTMEDVFREYVPEVITRKSKSGFSLYVVNPNSGYPYLKEPLILIDGVPVLNTDTLMAYDPLKVDRIEIVENKYFYGTLEADGIISMKTYLGKIDDLPPVTSHREKLVGIQAGEVYSFPNYSKDREALQRIPDYRLQLHWDPCVVVSNDQEANIEFYTSDVTGDFEVIVEGFTADGNVISILEVFSVVR
jgi:hypothetical protein